MSRSIVHAARRALLAALLVGALALPALAAPTTEQTIADLDGDDDRLELAPGEGYTVRDELADPRAGRETRRGARISFGQLSDEHIVDEESPLRFEYTDAFGPPLTSAYRPQEGMTAQVLDQMARQMRTVVSPITGRKVELVMTTGDNTDNTQLNETRWLIDVLDGKSSVDPDSGIDGGPCPVPVQDNGRLYDGVRGDQEYYEPDRSGPTGPGSVDGPGYSPDGAENEAEAGRSSTVRDFRDLFEQMNRSFPAAGLGVPWYGIFGNHDALVQGNAGRNEATEAVATGCVKLRSVSAVTAARIAAAAAEARESGRPDPDGLPGLEFALDEAVAATTGVGPAPDVDIVPPDPRRRPLKKSEYIRQHFNTSGRPVGHGFTQANIDSGQGNFVVRPKAGLRMVVLDSVAENGGANGNIDDAQFRWLHDQLLAAERAREVVFVFAHHTLRTLDQSPVSPFPPGDQGGNYSPRVHFGEQDPRRPQGGCPSTARGAPPTETESLRCLFLRHPSVLGYVVGHEHTNRVEPNRGVQGQHGFWEIGTASHIDYPQQSRALDLVDNRDGTLSIFTTVLDHAAPPLPSQAAGSTRLASISRELSFNDPDAQNGEVGDDGQPGADARGGLDDRNVELLVGNPYARLSGR